MVVESSLSVFQNKMLSLKKSGTTIGLVPTMGALHAGHLSLASLSLKQCQYTVVTIFVNPTQFAANEDLGSYPRELEEDLRQLEAMGVDFVFTPSEKDIYPSGYETYVYVKEMTQTLCGRSRPEHFEGVTTIVTKLFNLAMPDYAFFGNKDFQQAAVIKRMVKDLNFPIKIVCAPIVREKDGLAMSSRNKLLSKEARAEATILYKSLLRAKELAAEGSGLSQIKAEMSTILNSCTLAKIDYISLVDPDTLMDASDSSGAVLALVALFFGKTRLIDNMLISE